MPPQLVFSHDLGIRPDKVNSAPTRAYGLGSIISISSSTVGVDN